MSLVRTACIVCSFGNSDAHHAECEYRKPPQLQPHTESVEMDLTLQDAHLESALVCNVVMQGTLHKIWLPHKWSWII